MKKLKVHQWLSFVPFFGFVIVLFFGAFQIKKRTRRYFPTYTFMAFSLIALLLCALIALGVYYFFVVDLTGALMVVLALILFYSATVCAALLSSAILIKMEIKYRQMGQIEWIG